MRRLLTGSGIVPLLGVLTVEECLALLGSHEVGRLAVFVRGVPSIVPVNYVFEEPSIVVRTAPGTKLDHAPLAIVAFEVDEAPEGDRPGWSVTVQGPAFDITESHDDYSTALRRLPVVPWAAGEKRHWLKITAQTVTGLRFTDAKNTGGSDEDG